MLSVFALWEIVENHPCGKGKFGDFFEENFSLWNPFSKFGGKPINFFHFFCFKKTQKNEKFEMVERAMVENSAWFSKMKASAEIIRFQVFNSLFHTMWKSNIPNIRNLPAASIFVMDWMLFDVENLLRKKIHCRCL